MSNTMAGADAGKPDGCNPKPNLAGESSAKTRQMGIVAKRHQEKVAANQARAAGTACDARDTTLPRRPRMAARCGKRRGVARE